MSMTDPIADMLTRIRNAQSIGKTTVNMPASKLKMAIAQVLKDEGYIEDFAVREDDVVVEQLALAVVHAVFAGEGRGLAAQVGAQGLAAANARRRSASV